MAEPVPTERLLLRSWREDDLAGFAALNCHPEVMEHFPAPLTRQESDDLASRLDAHLAEHGWGLWAVEVNAGEDRGRFAGFTGLATPRFQAAFTPCVEVGWRLARWAWGRGYACEAAAVALDVGFTALDLDEIVSFTAVPNVRSQAVMQRIGMHRNPKEDFDHPALDPGHRLRRHVLYRLRAREWRTLRGGSVRACHSTRPPSR